MGENFLKDRFITGAIGGFIGGSVGMVYSYGMFLLGITPMSSLNLAATLVVMDIMNLTAGGVIWSLVTHLVVATMFGVLMAYVLLVTGKKYWVWKAVVIGGLFCLIAHSYLIPLMRTDVHALILNAPSFGVMITTHALIALIASFIIVRYQET